MIEDETESLQREIKQLKTKLGKKRRYLHCLYFTDLYNYFIITERILMLLSV